MTADLLDPIPRFSQRINGATRREFLVSTSAAAMLLAACGKDATSAAPVDDLARTAVGASPVRDHGAARRPERVVILDNGLLG